MPVHDIAVVTLNRDIPLGPKTLVGTVCLPSPSGVERPNRTAVVAGWGSTTRVVNLIYFLDNKTIIDG